MSRVELATKIDNLFNDPPDLIDSHGDVLSNSKSTFMSICSLLLEADIKHNETVGLLLSKTPYYLLCILACIRMGISYVPLSKKFPLGRLEEIKEDANISFFIDDDKLETLFKRVDANRLPALPEAHTLNTNVPLYIIFTSGSTGRPKGVVISADAFSAYANRLITDYAPEVSSKDRVLQIAEFSFDPSLKDVIFFLYRKSALYFSNFDGDPFRLALDIQKFQINVICTVPANLHMLLHPAVIKRATFDSLHTLLIGGSLFNLTLYQKVCRVFSDKLIVNMYGPTEFTVSSHAKRLKKEEEQDCYQGHVSIGNIGSGMQALIIRDEEEQCDFIEGELYLHGDQMMEGYIQNRTYNRDCLKEIGGKLYYPTGDLAFRNQSGEFYITGRTGDTVKHRGYRINLADIDSYIRRLPDINEALCIATPDEQTDYKIICFYVSENPDHTNKIPLKEQLTNIMTDYQIPQEFIQLNAFPRNTNGKTSRKMLEDYYFKRKN